MDEFDVQLTPHASRELESIFSYLASDCEAPHAAVRVVSALSEMIGSRHLFPQRGSLRDVGIYAGRGFRQVSADGYVIVYDVDAQKKRVTILTIKHYRQNFS